MSLINLLKNSGIFFDHDNPTKPIDVVGILKRLNDDESRKELARSELIRKMLNSN